MNGIGAVLIEGPKACGKTATALRIAKSTVRLDEDESARMALTLAPDQLFDQPTPILFDEWQVEPAIWNRVRRNVDDRGQRGLYILTGSATPKDDAKRHSGAGRIGTLRMRPMSLFESGHSSGDVSMRNLLNGHTQTGSGAALNFEDLIRQS
ncbi:AAA family ATPase [Pseudactinotalea sp. Z1739]|uniref:AAA family ATPase n=1 Tax=Pseudactinotalea sp. Z1739 TaxID=3413028 RepID=UPI003C7E1655